MNKRGVTLIEMLIALIISSIAMMALAVPLIAERAMVGSGKAQTESQRDAEVVMRAVARAARDGEAFTERIGYAPNGQIEFSYPSSTVLTCFQGGPTVTFNGQDGVLLMGGTCTVGGSYGPPAGAQPLIDGRRSNVRNFTITRVMLPPNQERLVRIHLEVTHEPIVGAGRQEDEVLETEIFLRNGP